MDFGSNAVQKYGEILEDGETALMFTNVIII